jgi:pyruvate,orthophosphate dikinase
MADEGLISIETARLRTAGLSAADLTTTVLAAEDGATLTPVARAATAASGVVSGEIAFDEARVRARKAVGTPVILVRRDAETRDISALDLADGLLTRHGARTSHAAVVARQLGKVCLVGCEEMRIDEARKRLELAGHVFEEGALITLDGNSGLIYAGAARIVKRVPEALLARLKALHQTA